MSTRSHAQTADGTRRPARSVPSASPARATRCTEALRDFAEDCTVVSEALLSSAYSAAVPNTELLQRLVSLRDLVDEAIGVVVVRQRAQGKPLAELAPIARITEDRLRRKYDPPSVDHSLTIRHRPKPVTPAQPAAAADGTPTPSRPSRRLAAALTRMRNSSNRRQRELAQQMGVDESYVSRMLSGQRDPSWKHVRTICEMCGTDPKRMKPLWEAAADVQPSNSDDPVQYLRTYLQGLHYALNSPDAEGILAATQYTISADDLDRALHGPGVPEWSVIDRLTVVLQSRTTITRPLWRRAQAAAENDPTTASS
ncbi:helix-turn-helix domain-containing protein [Streptomyces sp. RY43-2]|uniref:Helix-turn-helix domain-containing protein n=1 Tax=Streptomyces macrolidinus TaxID=2952607 RepID=A0ABT0ZAF6_9ACTN|nr:helix-turn-helix transcriptional regulator [Streptomyces macrolidinus]MCN9240402.1 helix-turn-helix domain-containing protein [Streptomyces macrolidinus]